MCATDCYFLGGFVRSNLSKPCAIPSLTFLCKCCTQTVLTSSLIMNIKYAFQRITPETFNSCVSALFTQSIYWLRFEKRSHCSRIMHIDRNSSFKYGGKIYFISFPSVSAGSVYREKRLFYEAILIKCHVSLIPPNCI